MERRARYRTSTPSNVLLLVCAIVPWVVAAFVSLVCAPLPFHIREPVFRCHRWLKSHYLEQKGRCSSRATHLCTNGVVCIPSTSVLYLERSGIVGVDDKQLPCFALYPKLDDGALKCSRIVFFCLPQQ